MKKCIQLLIFFSITAIILCSTRQNNVTDTDEQHAPNIIMQGRARWLQGIIIDLPDKRYRGIAKRANDLAAQTQKVAGNLSGEKKEITLKISAFALATAEAAKLKDNVMIKKTSWESRLPVTHAIQNTENIIIL